MCVCVRMCVCAYRSLSWHHVLVAEAHRPFAVKTFFANQLSVIVTRYSFRTDFYLARWHSVPGCNKLLCRVVYLRKTTSAVKKTPGQPRSDRTPANAEVMKRSVL